MAMQQARYAARGRVVLHDVLEPAYAEALRQCLLHWPQWALVAIIGGQHRNFDAAAMDQQPPARRAEFDALVSAQAQVGMQYLYERYPLRDAGRPPPEQPLLRELHDLLAGEPFLAMLRTLTGQSQINFADAQATRYRRGHYLTQHDDAAEGKHRVAAYVLGLTRGWRADHGGLLQFVDDAGRVDETLLPGFNTLTVFAVPTRTWSARWRRSSTVRGSR